MATFTDQDSRFFVDRRMSPNEPVRARDYNELRQNALFLRASKTAAWGAAYEGGDPPFGVDRDSGATFDCWRRLRAGETAVLLEATESEGVLSPTFVRWGFRGRFVAATLFARFADAAYAHNYAPGGAGVFLLFQTASEGVLYTGDGGGDHALTFTFGRSGEADDEYDEICLRLDASGRLTATFTPYASTPPANRIAAVFLRLDCSPLFPWRELDGPE